MAIAESVAKMWTTREHELQILYGAGIDSDEQLHRFAREQRITQLFLGHSNRDRSPAARLIDLAEDFDVRLFPARPS